MLRFRGSHGCTSGGGGGSVAAVRRSFALRLPLVVAVFAVTAATLVTRASSQRLCVDDETGFAQILARNGIQNSRGCIDAIGFCEDDSKSGQLARTFCCDTCGGGVGGVTVEVDVDVPRAPESVLPPGDEPLELFLLGGQSECVGQAQSADLYRSSEKYPELQGVIEGVWFAGYRGVESPETFFIAPLSADVDRQKFGPEVSFAERIRSATGGSGNVLMVKYCTGATSVRRHWNPETAENSWNRTLDDGTADWLETYTNFGEIGSHNEIKDHQFVNMVYTIRRTREALEEAGIPYEWSGIVWVQGLADKDPEDAELWKTFGENTARVWNGFREELERGGGSTAVPVIDTGGAVRNQLKSGKEYATQIVDGGSAATVELAISASDDTGTCTVTPSDPCLDADGWYQAMQVFDHFGYDPGLLEATNATSAKIFHWWVSYPGNLHTAYEGMILQGRMLANAFLREFADESEYDLTPFREDDVVELFPFEKCPEDVLPSPSNICWIDYRQAAELIINSPAHQQCLSAAAIEIRNGAQSEGGGGGGVFCDCGEDADGTASAQPRCYTSPDRDEASRCSILYGACGTVGDCCGSGFRTCRGGMCRTASRTSNRNSLRLSGNRGGAARNDRGGGLLRGG